MMKLRRTVIKASWIVAAWGAAMLILSGSSQGASPAAQAEPSAAPPAHRVLACYFHRTVRCPTCRKISAYIEEAVQTRFAAEIKDGRVSMVLVDFQNPKNKKYTEYFRITGPTLVLMDVHSDKVTAWKPAPKVWSLIGNKAAFLKYVQTEVRGYLEGVREAQRTPDPRR